MLSTEAAKFHADLRTRRENRRTGSLPEVGSGAFNYMANTAVLRNSEFACFFSYLSA
jgi:hypothetical protein